MSFSLHDFIMAGLRDAVGQLPDYKVIMNATGWYEKNVLTESDLAELQSLIDASGGNMQRNKKQSREGQQAV